ncbi:receptor-type tyrosine-protein phosphatase F isoform X1 [Hydra vulgaris]|uniref:receptor-type tyrosine-protein phosphatase F isoform X1 n=1 Tax=Hydra vulgaris TaxID=6087 RepID=UPI001F5F7D45|nr:receptor-type tyrosine-protein phosphatase F [Hydra vulgaris]
MIVFCSSIYAYHFLKKKNYGFLYVLSVLTAIDAGIQFTNNDPNRKIQVENNKNAVFEWQFNMSDESKLITFGFESKENSKEVYIARKQKNTPLEYNEQLTKRYGSSNVVISTDELTFAVLTLRSVQLKVDDGVKFFCQIRTSSMFVAKSTIVLEVITLPVFITKLQPVYTFNEHDKFLLSCGAEAKPAANLTLLKDGMTLSNALDKIEFEVLSAKKEHAGAYICLATNDAGSINCTSQIIIQYEPKINREKSTIRIGSYINNPKPTTLLCIADGFPEPTYRWNNPLGHQNAVTSTYTFQMPTSSHFGDYVCQAYNIVGVDTLIINVFEISKPDTVEVSIKYVTAQSAMISYVIPTNLGNGVLKKLCLSYWYSGSNPINIALNSSLTMYEINNLVPYTEYTVNITVQNEFFTSDDQIQKFKTSAAAPSSPANIKATALSSTHIMVQWDPPKHPNGVITNYSVKFFEQNSLSFDEAKLLPQELNLKADFENLKPNTPYLIFVQASNAAGSGEWSKEIIESTEPLAPGEPLSVKVEVLDSQNVKIIWFPPEMTEESTMYEFKWSYYSKETHKTYEESLQVKPGETENRVYLLTKMLPYSDYSISVREAVGNNIWGNFSDPVNFTLPEGVPDIPMKLTMLKTTHDESLLMWLRPNRINGVLRKFAVDYENESGIYSDTIAVNNQNNETFYHTILNLKDSAEYTVSVKAFSSKFYSTPSNAIRFKTLPGTSIEISAQTATSSNTGQIYGGVFSVVALIMLSAVIYIFSIRKRRLKRKCSETSQSILKLSNIDCLPVNDLESMQHSSSINSFIPSEYAQSLQRTFAPLKPISVSALKDYVLKQHANRDKGFIDEFRSIKPEGDFTFEISMRPENKCKNRYANILAYDHSRVVLNTVENLEGSDYVNANYIDGYTRKSKFIATQGPVQAAFKDFWRMVWEQNTETIVMITNFVEKSRIKCQKYWPNINDKFEIYGDINVEIVDETELADYIVRRFKVYHIKFDRQKTRLVMHYQFLSWPDHGVPQFGTPLLQFVKRVRSVSDQNSGPIVLHCSAGVGRTGTYIAIDNMLDQIALEKTVDIFGCVTHIRTQRSLMVQTEGQYIFIYKTLLEAVSCGNTEVTADELQARIKHLDNLNPGSAKTYLQEEFDRLDLNLEINSSYESAILPANIEKNRFNDVLPYESTRVKLWPFPEVEGSDYINASFIDGYQQREAYILTQAPLETSIHDFWRMVWEYEVFSLVMISSVKERDKHHCYPYWPIKNEAAVFDLLRVQIAAEEEKTGFVKREFIVTNSKNGESRTVSHLMFFDWPEDEAPNIANILEMIGQLQNIQQKTGNGSIIIHCSDGSGRSGTLAALMYCLERIKHEAMVDVFQTIRSMRTQRIAIVNTLALYQFIYAAVRSFLDCFSAYSNFK